MTVNAHPVLVVEDDADIRDATVGLPDAKGYAVRAAAVGRYC